MTGMFSELVLTNYRRYGFERAVAVVDDINDGALLDGDIWCGASSCELRNWDERELVDNLKRRLERCAASNKIKGVI